MHDSKIDCRMTEMGQNAKYSRRAKVFRSTPNIRHSTARLVRQFRAITGREHIQQTMCANLLDHLVGAHQYRCWDCDVDRSRSLEIHGKLECGWLFHR